MVHFARAKEGKYMYIMFFFSFFLSIFQCWNISSYILLLLLFF